MKAVVSGVQAIIILYYPNLIQVQDSVRSLIDQVDQILLVDNTPINHTLNILNINDVISCNRLIYLNMGENIGVARAQNFGIKKAIEGGAEYVLVMDQDSIAASNMVNILKKDLLFLENCRYKISAIGPEPVNVSSNKAYKPRIKKRKHFKSDRNILRVSEIISSGSLIRTKLFEEIGFMDEELFIDGVDHEWCWRARQRGYNCALTQKTQLLHMLGEGDKKLFGISIAITSPFRIFYQYRNYFYLLNKNYVPVYWKVNNGIKYIIKFFYYPVFVHPQKQYLKNILKGIKLGLRHKK